MEFFIWGLLSLVPQAIAYRLRRSEMGEMLTVFGFIGFPLALSVAAGRATQSVKVGTRAFLFWFAVLLVLVPISFKFQLDSRCTPPTVHLVPFLYEICNPARGDTMTNATTAAVCYAAGCSIAVRCSIGRLADSHDHCIAVILSGIVFGILLTLHFGTAASSTVENDREGFRMVISVYMLMLAFGLYFVALFYDFSPRLPLQKSD